MRENHYAILASVSEFPTFTNYKMSITLLFSYVLGRVASIRMQN